MIRYPEFHYSWQWRLQADPTTLWPLVTDTNHFNHDTSVPAIERYPITAEPPPNARRQLRLFRLGVPVEWEEEPFEWVQPFRFGVVRNYHSGPVAKMSVVAELKPLPEGGTYLSYRVWARPKNPLGLIAIPAQIGVLSARQFDRVFRQYDQLAVNHQPLINLFGSVSLAPGGSARLQSLRRTLLERGSEAEIIDPLIELIERGDDLTVSRLQPYKLADLWDIPRQRVLENFLLATRGGLLRFQWDLLCPLCRGVKDVNFSLRDLHTQVHCDTCNIDFGINFERSVELTFHPNPAIREVEQAEYCISGPQTTPHVVIQQLLDPDETRTVTPAIGEGRYRLRTLNLRGGEYLGVTQDGEAELTLRASSIDGWPDGERRMSSTPTLHLKNATNDEQLFILEHLAWSDQAVTAAEVTVMQTFRDLFAEEALRPGEQISVGSLTILFTDLRGSTQMYNEIGDAPAFGLVMSHFDVLRAAISAEGGAIVKTIGDAVMAVFRRPAPALRAIINAQQLLALDERPLELRAGIHYGPCITVTLNDKLDYFGSTVNVAARLETFSTGRDVVISNSVRSDPEVVELLESAESSLAAECFVATLKGFNSASFDLWRVKPRIVDAEFFKAQ